MQTGNIKAHAADAAAKKREKGLHEEKMAMMKKIQLELIEQYCPMTWLALFGRVIQMMGLGRVVRIF
eukprot:3405438-Ditylum_brightwellii.AAC.1